MGGGIAMNFANAGIPVRVLELSQEALDKGLGVVKKNYAATVSKGRLSQEDMDKRVGLLKGVTSYDELKDADIVIEAVFEDMAVKKQVFEKLDKVCKPGAILATNTSTLDVNEIAAMTSRPESVIGLHFFSPANVMRLLEVVRAAKTSKEVLATSMKLAKTIKKVGVVAGVCDGFIGNRMLHGYFREAGFLLEEGALPQQVDKVIEDFGFAMGPFRVSDLAGLDVGWYIRKRQAATRPPHLRYSKVADQICELGRFGQKTGAGWYRYEAGNRARRSRTPKSKRSSSRPRRMPASNAVRSATRKSWSVACTRWSTKARRFWKRVSRCARATSTSSTSTATGFPRYRGGPMFYADTVGLDKVYASVKRFHESAWPFLDAGAIARTSRPGRREVQRLMPIDVINPV